MHSVGIFSQQYISNRKQLLIIQLDMTTQGDVALIMNFPNHHRLTITTCGISAYALSSGILTVFISTILTFLSELVNALRLRIPPMSGSAVDRPIGSWGKMLPRLCVRPVRINLKRTSHARIVTIAPTFSVFWFSELKSF